MRIDMENLETRIFAIIRRAEKPVTVKQISRELAKGYRPTMPTMMKAMVNLHIRGTIEKLPQRTKMKEVLWIPATK